MVLDERSRHELYLKLEEVLGPERAETLMEMLPPVGWADVATKRDLDLRFEAFEHKMMAALKAEMAALKGEIAAQTRTVVFAVLGSVLGSTSLSLLAARVAS